MRIALLNPSPQRRGAELGARDLAAELARRGHRTLELYLYPPPPGDGLPAAENELQLGGRSGHWLERVAGWEPRLATRLRRALQEFRPDVVQVSGGRAVKYGVLTASHLARRPLRVYCNIGEPGAWVRGWRRRWLYSRVVFPRVDAVVTVGRSFVPRLERLCPNARVVRWIPRGVDRRRLAPASSRESVRAGLGSSREAPAALFLGSLSPEKRVDRLLRAFHAAAARLPAAELWIAGGGPLEGELRGQAAALGLEPRVRFLGIRDDVGDLLNAADLVALTSDTEGVPRVLREAACAGRCAVATRVGSTAEVVVDGETGVLVEPADEPALAAALTELLADAERRERLGAAALRHFEATGHSIEAVAGAHEQLYREALEREAGG